MLWSSDVGNDRRQSEVGLRGLRHLELIDFEQLCVERLLQREVDHYFLLHQGAHLLRVHVLQLTAR